MAYYLYWQMGKSKRDKGITSRMPDLLDAAVRVRYVLPELLGSRHADSYSTWTIQRLAVVWVKRAFLYPTAMPSPFMYPQPDCDGSLLRTSSGASFGSPGFYSRCTKMSGSGQKTSCEEPFGCVACRKNQVRADYVLRFGDAIFSRLHYRLQLAKPECRKPLSDRE